MSSWVKLHTQILGSAVFASEGLLKVWIYCLCRANRKKRYVPISTGRGETIVTVNPGQFIYGRKSAARDLKMNESTVYKRMLKLKKMGNCNIQSNSHYSIVTVCNWDSYQSQFSAEEQGKEQASNRQVTGKEQASNRQVTQTETDKTVKKVKTGRERDARAREFPGGINGSEYRPPSVEQVLAYAGVHAIPEKVAKEFFWHYDGTGWEDAYGRPIKNWASWLNKWQSREPQFKQRAIEKDKSVKGKIDGNKIAERHARIFKNRRHEEDVQNPDP